MKRLPIYQGGLMRCCLDTLSRYSGPTDEGIIVKCEYCGETMIVRDQAWHWLPTY